MRATTTRGGCRAWACAACGRAGVILAVAFAAAVSSRPVAAQSAGCTGMITAVPHTISAPGVYCLAQNLALTTNGGYPAIGVASDSVVVDLKGFRLTGLSIGPGSYAYGIAALDQKNITVRNGTVRGFYIGVFLNDSSPDNTASGGHVVEQVTAIDNTWAGIYLNGRGNVVRNNIVRNTGGTTIHGPNVDTAGIITIGSGARVIGNDVIDTIGVGTEPGRSVRVIAGVGSVAESNRLSNSSASSHGVGLSIEYAVYDVLLLDNRIGSMSSGIAFFPGATGKYGRNVTAGVAQPYSGGTDLGNNQ
jgi:hypothetical protein